MKMDDSELLSFLQEEERQARDFSQGDIAADRNRAQRAYMRDPYGNEQEGRSAVVTSDVFDAVEGMLPDLIEVFTSSDKAVIFEPTGPEDEESAEQVTNACNYVFYKQNNGFLILYTALKNALLLKTGGVKWYWEEKQTPTFTTYRDVDELQIAHFLATNPDAKIMSKEEADPSEEELAMAQAGYPVPLRYTVKVKTVQKKGIVRVVAIPPEELRVSRRHDSILLDDCGYVAHVTRKTLSEIRECGYQVDAEDVQAAQNEDIDWTAYSHGERDRRFTEDNTADESSVSGWLHDEYVLVDYDGDGIAERRRIVRLGPLILENTEVSHVPIAAWTPYILTHSFNGLSVADLVEDFQRIHTTVMRQQIDNLYLANNQETVVLTDSQGNPLANIDDLLNRRPGGIIRSKQPGAVMPYQERWQGIEAMPMLEQLSSDKENRTGWTRYSQGLDGDSLNKTATGAQMIMNASQKRMKLMARIAAECMVAPMFRGIFKTLSDYGMQAISYRLNGKFVQYDPQEWRDQYDMTINVGIGTGDVQQQSQFLMQIAQAQAAVAGSPYAKQLLSPKHVYNVQARLAENAGFKNPDEFWVDPDTVPPDNAPPPPNPAVELEKAKLQDAQHKAAAEMQQKQRLAEQDLAFKERQAELDREHALRMEELRLQHEQQNRAMEVMARPSEQEPGQEEAMLRDIQTQLAMLTHAIAVSREPADEEGEPAEAMGEINE
ncbi:hypothetical protein [Pseudomonas sp.]|uniref:portal protein n=1 Tax=Pseudomonas sp. TaxID=306 RepID=UPI00258430B8|nr:hypothetical protein [Pseudomonas sp.]